MTFYEVIVHLALNAVLINSYINMFCKVKFGCFTTTGLPYTNHFPLNFILRSSNRHFLSIILSIEHIQIY